MRYIFLFVLLLGCGGPHEPKLELNGFDEYVEYFEQMSYDKGRPTEVIDLIVKFENTKQFGENTVGYAFWGGDKTPEIWIDKEFWEESNDCDRLALIMHEIGHAVYGYSHRNNVKSVMNSYIVHDYCVNENYYLEEFFWFNTDKWNPVDQYEPTEHDGHNCGQYEVRE